MKTGRVLDLLGREVFSTKVARDESGKASRARVKRRTVRAYGIPHVSVRPDGERPDVTSDGVVREREKRVLHETVGFAQMRHDLVEGPEVDKIDVPVAASHPAGEAQVLSERNR